MHRHKKMKTLKQEDGQGGTVCSPAALPLVGRDCIKQSTNCIGDCGDALYTDGNEPLFTRPSAAAAPTVTPNGSSFLINFGESIIVVGVHSDIAINCKKRLHRAGSCNARGQCPTPSSKNAASIKPFQFFLSRGLKLRGEDVFLQQCM